MLLCDHLRRISRRVVGRVTDVGAEAEAEIGIEVGADREAGVGVKGGAGVLMSVWTRGP